MRRGYSLVLPTNFKSNTISSKTFQGTFTYAVTELRLALGRFCYYSIDKLFREYLFFFGESFCMKLGELLINEVHSYKYFINILFKVRTAYLCIMSVPILNDFIIVLFV